MMSTFRRLLCLAALASVLAAASAFASSHTDKDKASAAAVKKAEPAKSAPAKAEAQKTDPAHDAMMAEMMKLGAPGPAHDKLKGLVGDWKAVVKSWMSPGEPAVSEGSCENKLVLGGRYVEQQFKGTFMDMPFEGIGFTGYDNKRGVYTTFWADNMSTATMGGDGAMNAAGDELVVKSKMDGPDGKPTDARMVTKIVDPNKHVFSMYGTMDGKEQLMMEITYTRQ